MTAKKSRSGTKWTDTDWERAGYSRLTLRPRTEIKADLIRQAAADGSSVSLYLEPEHPEEK
jgi:hypothetical protein